mmetsp:Transcript_16577/g.50190  ORF Transcript_16577/g.50190 Transcript_16577/m.50190 type:complete len:205 (+) Transcript_16577:944-1558(+)
MSCARSEQTRRTLNTSPPRAVPAPLVRSSKRLAFSDVVTVPPARDDGDVAFSCVCERTTYLPRRSSNRFRGSPRSLATVVSADRRAMISTRDDCSTMADRCACEVGWHQRSPAKVAMRIADFSVRQLLMLLPSPYPSDFAQVVADVSLSSVRSLQRFWQYGVELTIVGPSCSEASPPKRDPPRPRAKVCRAPVRGQYTSSIEAT